VVGVQLQALHAAACREPHDRPVVAGAAAAARLPAVAHVRRAPGQDQVLAVAEEHVAAHHDEAAVLHRRQVQHLAAREPRGIGPRFAVHAQPRHAAVGIDVEAQVRQALVTREGERVLRVARER
jgi:hypothetical protein